MKFFKPVKSFKDVNVAIEVFAELSASRLSKIMGFPLLDLKITEKEGKIGLLMDHLPEKADENVTNIDKIRSALAFEEVILNIDLKEEHVLSKEKIAYIIDHGHSFNAWKPLYYIQEIIDKKVSRFNLWSNREKFMEGVEIINSVDDKNILEILRDTAEEVYQYNFCKLFDRKAMEETIDLSFRIFRYRKRILPSLF
ncbi:hypothetical protein [Acidianus ambivalens]|uniref:Uncharacterized protein n=1 Tax=Acidianus ambivalens TaxID=2283 RepID=A0A650CVG3_ACIAM|nr:hypothetical protein [Acidianus ambivalens]MQL55797.1 hypothetical protein [Acidianus ambivalens]QGR21632.1 hypothetical protein D1866_06210 [Acidianus ambivalens]